MVKERWYLVSIVWHSAYETEIFYLQVMPCPSGHCAFPLIHSSFWQLQMMGTWSCMMCMYCAFS